MATTISSQSSQLGMQSGLNKQVKDCMSKRLECCTESDTLRTAANKMKTANVGCLGVMSNGNLVGMITDRDIVTRCLAEGKDYTKCTVGDCMTRDVHTISPTESMQKAHDLMCQRNVRRLIVGEKGTSNFGIISKSDFVAGNKA